MRPRVFPAEDISVNEGRVLLDTGFNEAAGIPRGRPQRLQSPLVLAGRLQ